MKNPNEIFVYDNIYFETGIRDKDEHPVIVAGVDDNYLYCFSMTSKTKHIAKNSHERNMYNENVKYVQTIPGKNCSVNNNLPGLINTSHCFTIPKEVSRQYNKFGYISAALAKEVMVKWAYQQNEIKDKRDWNYNQICQAFGIDETIKNHDLYAYCQALMNNYPQELENQKQYAKEVRIYRETRYQISKQNKARYANGQPPLSYPKEPRLADDKGYLANYTQPPAPTVVDNPFAELSKQLFGDEESSKTKEELISLKGQLISMQEALNNQPAFEEVEEEVHHRKAA